MADIRKKIHMESQRGFFSSELKKTYQSRQTHIKRWCTCKFYNSIIDRGVSDLPVMVPTATTAPLGWKPADLPWSCSTEQFRFSWVQWWTRFLLSRNLHTGLYLNSLAPERLMGVGVPQVNLFVLRAGDKLLHGGVDIQTPQFICVTLWTSCPVQCFMKPVGWTWPLVLVS